jgi:hypothetical protein
MAMGYVCFRKDWSAVGSSGRKRRVADASTAGDVARGDQLEATRTHGASDGGVSGSNFLLRKVFLLIFFLLCAFFLCAEKFLAYCAQ